MQPGAIGDVDIGVCQKFGQDCGFRQLTEMVHNTLPFRDEIELLSERLSVLHKRMIGPGNLDVLATALADNLLASLHAHLEVRDQNAVL
jgi:hypothetical protein